MGICAKMPQKSGMIDYQRVEQILWRICPEVVAYCEQGGTN